MKTALALLFCIVCTAPAAAGQSDDLLLGSVVKSDRWKMDRVKDTETFTGNVSFKNPRYTLKADTAVYTRAKATWDLDGSVYVLRTFEGASLVEMRCQSARYLENEEAASLRRGALPVRLHYLGADGRILNAVSDSALAENPKRQMAFDGDFVLSTENLELASQQALYDDALQTFLLRSTSPAAALAERPAAVGKREGYDFAITAENIKFFKDSRDIKFYNKVAGWVKDQPLPAK